MRQLLIARQIDAFQLNLARKTDEGLRKQENGRTIEMARRHVWLKAFFLSPVFPGHGSREAVPAVPAGRAR